MCKIIILFLIPFFSAAQCIFTPVEEIYIPNAFTPNNDGINDILFVLGNDECCKFEVLKIFNRWGEKVFETNDINIGWDGTHHGQLVDIGVFVYFLKTDCSEEMKKGTITVLK